MVDAEAIVKELRGTYGSGKTKSYEWRVSQLKALLKIAENHEKEIADALYSDLSKPELEAFIHEVYHSSPFSVFIISLSAWRFRLNLYYLHINSYRSGTRGRNPLLKNYIVYTLFFWVYISLYIQ